MFISFSNGHGSTFENSLDSGYSFASVPARCRQRCSKRGSGDGQRHWDYFMARLSDLQFNAVDKRGAPEPSARPSAAADSEERQICTTCLFAKSIQSWEVPDWDARSARSQSMTLGVVTMVTSIKNGVPYMCFSCHT